jgi:cyclopropane-fatty-acyl-phospholipid synthase
MLEAIGHEQYGTFFAACDRLLAPNGIACIQTIAIPDQRYERYRRTKDWIQEYVFPGSLLPSLTALTNAMTRRSSLVVFGLEDIGIHYADTLRSWRERFFAHLEDVRGLGYDARFERVWEFYLSYCEAAFATRSLRDLQLVLTRSFNDQLPRYPSPRVTF